MYSLLNASALGFDLVRLPGGPVAAGLLVDALVDPHGDPDPSSTRALGVYLQPAPQPLSAVRGRESQSAPVKGRAERGERGRRQLATVGTLLALAPASTLDDLTAFVSREVFASSWVGEPDLQVRDRAAAASVDRLCAHLERAWRSRAVLRAGLRPVGDLGPQTDRLRRALAAATDLTAADVAAAEAGAAGVGSWSQGMHDVGHALVLSGRERTFAVAELHLVLALRHPALAPEVLAGGGWNALSGVVAAVLVEDLLGSETLSVLRDPCARWLSL